MNARSLSISIPLCLAGFFPAAQAAGAASGSQDPAPYMAKLDSSDALERETAARALGNMGEAARPAQGRLLAALKDKEDAVRVMAAYALERTGYDPGTVVSAFTACLQAQAPEVRTRAAVELGGYADRLNAKQKKTAITALLSVADADTAAAARANAIFSLAHLGAGESQALDILLKGLNGEAEPVRAASAYSLSVICPRSGRTVPALIPLLSDKSVEVREAAATALGRVGKTARPALEALNKLVADPELRVRDAALRAVAKITASRS